MKYYTSNIINIGASLDMGQVTSTPYVHSQRLISFKQRNKQ